MRKNAETFSLSAKIRLLPLMNKFCPLWVRVADSWVVNLQMTRYKRKLIGAARIEAVLLRSRSIKKPDVPSLQSGVQPRRMRSQQVCAASLRDDADGSAPKCLVVPRVEPAGERTTCRRDRWGQTAVVHLYLRPPRACPRSLRHPRPRD